MNLHSMKFSEKKMGMKLSIIRFWFVLLMLAILSVFGMMKWTGISNDAARIDADLANKTQVNPINSRDDSHLDAGILAQIEDKNSHSKHRQDQVLHGWCQYRSQHLTSV